MVTIDTGELVGWGAFGVLLTAYVISKVIKIEQEAKQIRLEVSGISQVFISQLDNLKDIELPSLDIDDIKEEILGAVEDFLGNMHVPGWQDHLMGMAAQFLQAKMMNAIPPEMQGVVEGTLIDSAAQPDSHATE